MHQKPGGIGIVIMGKPGGHLHHSLYQIGIQQFRMGI
jgi:hypothetical protein